jgi:hypothetical protein
MQPCQPSPLAFATFWKTNVTSSSHEVLDPIYSDVYNFGIQ